MKLNKKNSKKGNVEVESTEVEIESPVAELETPSVPEPASDPVEAVLNEVIPQVEVPQVPAVSQPVVKEGYVKIVMLGELNPSPTIGHFNCVRELKVSRMQQGESYFVPSDVALTLVDCKKAVIQA